MIKAICIFLLILSFLHECREFWFAYKYEGSKLEVEKSSVGLQKRHFLSLKAWAIFEKWTSKKTMSIFEKLIPL